MLSQLKMQHTQYTVDAGPPGADTDTLPNPPKGLKDKETGILDEIPEASDESTSRSLYTTKLSHKM